MNFNKKSKEMVITFAIELHLPLIYCIENNYLIRPFNKQYKYKCLA